MVSCPMYKDLRENLLPPQILRDKHISDEQKFVEIMTNYDMKATAKFVYQAFNEREIRLDVLSTLNEIVSSTEILLKNVNQNTSHPGTTDIYQVKWCSNDGLKLRLSKI